MLFLGLVHQDQALRVQVFHAEQTDTVGAGQVDQFSHRLVRLGVQDLGVAVKVRVR